MMVSRSITVPVEPDRLWLALTRTSEIESWFGARIAWELEPGGSVHVPAADGEPDRTGRISEVAPGEELRFTWWPDGDEAAASEVRYVLEQVDGGTRFTVTEEPVAAPAAGRVEARAGCGSPAAVFAAPLPGRLAALGRIDRSVSGQRALLAA